MLKCNTVSPTDTCVFNITELMSMFIQLVLIVSIATWSAVTYGDYIYPTWTTSVGWCLALSSLLPIPVTAAIKIFTANEINIKQVEFLFVIAYNI